MSLSKDVQKNLLERGYSRRQVARIALGAAAVIPFFHEFAFAQDDAAPARISRSNLEGGQAGERLKPSLRAMHVADVVERKFVWRGDDAKIGEE